ncbi:MAG TPA: hypothetical protein VHP58_03560 [Alphaproteobacteria bacterium]|nr:hypothetical protein [Alphaproteobacteria bacterium]
MLYQSLSGFWTKPGIMLTALLAALASLSATEAFGATEKQPDRQELCKQYADAQFKAFNPKPVSGTTLTFQYDDKSGFCTVEVKNKDAKNAFLSRTMTNTFDASPTVLPVPVIEPVRIVWKPAPQVLVCDKVIAQKDGKRVCEPHKPNQDEVFDPFYHFGWW